MAAETNGFNIAWHKDGEKIASPVLEDLAWLIADDERRSLAAAGVSTLPGEGGISPIDRRVHEILVPGLTDDGEIDPVAGLRAMLERWNNGQFYQIGLARSVGGGALLGALVGKRGYIQRHHDEWYPNRILVAATAPRPDSTESVDSQLLTALVEDFKEQGEWSTPTMVEVVDGRPEQTLFKQIGFEASDRPAYADTIGGTTLIRQVMILPARGKS